MLFPVASQAVRLSTIRRVNEQNAFSSMECNGMVFTELNRLTAEMLTYAFYLALFIYFLNSAS